MTDNLTKQQYIERLAKLMHCKTYTRKKGIIYFTDKYDEDFVCALLCSDDEFDKAKKEFRKK